MVEMTRFTYGINIHSRGCKKGDLACIIREEDRYNRYMTDSTYDILVIRFNRDINIGREYAHAEVVAGEMYGHRKGDVIEACLRFCYSYKPNTIKLKEGMIYDYIDGRREYKVECVRDIPFTHLFEGRIVSKNTICVFNKDKIDPWYFYNQRD